MADELPAPGSDGAARGSGREELFGRISFVRDARPYLAQAVIHVMLAPLESKMAVRSWSTSSPLGVFARSSFTGGAWASVLAGAISTFNELMSKNSVSLALAAATDENKAQIVVDAVANQASFSYGGASYSKEFDGNGMHGRTVPVADPDTMSFERAFVFVPATPRVDRMDKKSREAGAEVRRFILIHEFIHAAGLSNDEHTLDDVFCYPGEIVQGNKPQDDRLQPWGGLGKPMPPYTISAKTIANLKKAWP